MLRRPSYLGSVVAGLLLLLAGLAIVPGVSPPPSPKIVAGALPPSVPALHGAQRPFVGPPFVTATIGVRDGTRVAGNVFPGDASPSGIAIDPVDGTLVMTGLAGPFLALLNETSMNLSRYDFLGNASVAIAFVPGSAVAFIAEKGATASQVAVVNLTTDARLATIPLTSPAYTVAWDGPDGTMIVGESDGTVLSVSAANRTVVAEVSGYGAITGLAVDPSLHRLFLANGSRSVPVLNASTLQAVGFGACGQTTTSVAYDPKDGNVYVANYRDDNVTVLNASTLASARQLAVGNGPTEVATDPSGDLVYVANALSDNVTIVPLSTPDLHGAASGGFGGPLVYEPAYGRVALAVPAFGAEFFDGVTGNPLGSTQTHWRASAMALDANGGRLYVSDLDLSSVAILDLARNRSIANAVPVGGIPSYLALNGPATELYASSVGGGVAVYNISLGQTTAAIPVGYLPGPLAVDPGRGNLYVGDQAFGSVYQVSTENHTVEHSATIAYGAGWVLGLAYSPKTDRVYAATGLGLYGFNASGLQPLGTAGLGPGPGAVVASPYDDLVYVARPGLGNATGNVTVVNGSSMAPAGELRSGGHPSALAFDPDNGYLFASDPWAADLTVFDTVHHSVLGNVSLLAPAEDLAYDPSTGLVYASEGQTGAIAVVDPNTPRPVLSSATVAPSSVTMAPQSSVRLSATAWSDFGLPIVSGATFTWSWSDTALGRLSGTSGAMTTFTAGAATGSGTLWLNVSYRGVTLGTTVPITVSGTAPPSLASATISPASASLIVGGVQSFDAAAVLTDGLPAPSSTTYTWSLSSATLGYLSGTSGPMTTFTAATVGSGLLSVSASYGGASVTAQSVLAVGTPPGPVLAGVELVPRQTVLNESTIATFFAVAVATDGSNVSSNASFEWSVTPTSLGTTTVRNGFEALFRPLVANGTGTLTVTAAIGTVAKSNSSSITVATHPAPIVGPPPTNATSFWDTPVAGVSLWIWLAVGAGVALLGALTLVLSRRARPPPEEPEDASDAPGAPEPFLEGGSPPDEGRTAR